MRIPGTRISIRFANPVRLRRLTELMKINGTSVYIHWSVFFIATVLLLNALHRPLLTLAGLAAWLGVILIHECGHMIAARRRGCTVLSIQLYPIFGITCFDTPWSRFDHCVIAWGGVLAQAVVGVPFVAWVIFFGYTRFDTVNAVLALLGFYSLSVAAFNLIPMAPLDGAIAWQIIPAAIDRRRQRRNRMIPTYRSP